MSRLTDETVARDPIGLLVAWDDAALRSMARRELLRDHARDQRGGAPPAPGCHPAAARWPVEVPGREPDIRSRAAYASWRPTASSACWSGHRPRPPASGGCRRGGILVVVPTEAGDYRGITATSTRRTTRRPSPKSSSGPNTATPQVEHTCDGSSIGQDDGGWAIPTRTLGMSLNVMYTARETFEPDRSRRWSTWHRDGAGALAAHPGYRHSAHTRRAAELLTSRLFRRALPGPCRAVNWPSSPIPSGGPTAVRERLPPQIGFRPGDPDIARGLAFTANQEPSGLWNTGRNRPKGPHSDLWVALAICRMLIAITREFPAMP